MPHGDRKTVELLQHGHRGEMRRASEMLIVLRRGWDCYGKISGRSWSVYSGLERGDVMI